MRVCVHEVVVECRNEKHVCMGKVGLLFKLNVGKIQLYLGETVVDDFRRRYVSS